MKMAPLRKEVLELYKTLLYMGKDYPQGYAFFRIRLGSAFRKHKDVSDPVETRRLLDKGYYVVKELEVMYSMRKYRFLKNHYYDGHGI